MCRWVEYTKWADSNGDTDINNGDANNNSSNKNDIK